MKWVATSAVDVYVLASRWFDFAHYQASTLSFMIMISFHQCV